MTIKKEIFKNSYMFIVYQIFLIVFKFVSKPIMLKYIGEEMLGIGSSIAAILGTLSLAELGFHAAVIYHLYKPLSEKDYNKCNEYMMVLRFCYRIIGCFIIAFTFLLSPFLKYLIKGTDITVEIYAIYFLSGFASAVGYFFADRAQLLFADRKDYIAKRIELLISVVLMTAELIVVCLTKNYLIYCSMVLFRGLLIGIITACYTDLKYTWLRKQKINRECLKEIIGDVKNLAVANFAGYVYYNTDSLVISVFLGPIKVTYFGIYTCITTSLRSVADLGVRQVEPFLGKVYAKDNSADTNYPIFMVNTFTRFIIAGMLIIPTYILLNDFIVWWVGEKYILSNCFLVLLCLDFYFFIVHRALSDYITITGNYNYEKKISLVGALINLTISVLLINSFGLEGVLFGTVTSEFVYWFGRGYVVFNKIFKLEKQQIVEYVLKNILYIVCAFITVALAQMVNNLIVLDSFVIGFIVKGILIELCFLVMCLAFFSRTNEYKNIVKFLRR